MARGAPDYSNVSVGQPLHRVDDLAELAARLGSPVAADRGGNVIESYDFQYGAGMIAASDGGLGETIEVSPNYSRYGGFTLLLSRVANANSYAGFIERVSAVTSGRIGAEVLFVAATNTSNLKLYLTRYTGSRYIPFGCRWDATSGKVYVRIGLDVWEEVASGKDMAWTYPMLHSVKLVVSEDDMEHVCCILDGETIDLSGHATTSTANTTQPNTVLEFYNGLDPVWASDIYVDAFIITINEP